MKMTNDLIHFGLLGTTEKKHEIENGGERIFKTRGFYNFCIKWIGPLFMAMIVYGQFTSFWGGK